MERSSIKKAAAIVNSVILLLVFGLMSFFAFIDIPFLVAFSIPTACIYIVGFYIIQNDKLDLYIWLIYTWLTLYMGVSTVCLGYGYGFHLYCFSMIPIMFATEYIAYKLRNRSMKALMVSIIIAVFYIICTGYVTYFGPIYERDKRAATFFWIFNAVVVFSFLIYFSSYLIRLIIQSEESLKKSALIDHLTKLYNRHYMFERLNKVFKDNTPCVLAMTDIDDFKLINDTYGHNAGDKVLKSISEIIKSECNDCEISRWGGEEFLILSYSTLQESRITFEKLRKKIESSPVLYDGTQINATITIGVASRIADQTIDKLIKTADDRLYFGKSRGKNCVIINTEE